MKEPKQIPLTGSQTAALRLQQKELRETTKYFNNQLDLIKTAWAELFTVIRKEVGITEEDSKNWHITKELDSFIYEVPAGEKENKSE